MEENRFFNKGLHKDNFYKDELDFVCMKINSLEEFSSLIDEYMDVSFLFEKFFGVSRYIFFRGVSKSSYDIQSSLEVNNLVKNEGDLYKRMLYHAPEYFDSCQSKLDQLALMRHHGVPIRCVDFSKNPYVALFFACSSDFEYEGAVYFALTSKKIYNNSFLKDIVCKRACMDYVDLKYAYNGACTYYSDKEIKYLVDLYSNDNEGIFFHEIPYRDDRERNQQGLFLLGLDRLVMKKKCGVYLYEPITINNVSEPQSWIEKSIKHEATYDEHINMICADGIQCYREDSKKYILKVMIPSSIKKGILKKLSHFGITEDFIYPSLENYAKKLTAEFFE